eukprot:3722631-Pleurochrysis_carterae.AAC.2
MSVRGRISSSAAEAAARAAGLATDGLYRMGEPALPPPPPPPATHAPAPLPPPAFAEARSSSL